MRQSIGDWRWTLNLGWFAPIGVLKGVVVFDDPLEKLAQLRDHSDVFAQKMSAVRASGSSYSGNDETGIITANLGVDGEVAGIVVGRDWRQKIGVERMAAAVQEAVRAAAIGRVQVWSEAFVEQDEADDPAPRPMALLDDTFAQRLSDAASLRMTREDSEATLRQLLALAEAIEDSIDQVSDQIQAAMNASYTGRSQSHNVSVTMTGGGDLTGIQYDKYWLMDASDIAISRETTEAFQAAYRQFGQQTTNDIIARSPLGEVKDLSEDPLALARRLNLLG